MARDESRKTNDIENSSANTHSQTIEREGLLRGAITIASSISEYSIKSSFALGRDLRLEIFDRANETLDWADNFQQTGFRMLRRILERGFAIGASMTDATEGLLVGTTRLVRDTGHGVTDLTQKVFVNTPPEGNRQPRATA